MTYFLFVLLLSFSPSHYITITNDGETVMEIKKEQLSDPIVGNVFIDDQKYHAILEKVKKEVMKQPINATIDDFNQIKNGENGYELYTFEFQKQLLEAYYKNGNVRIEAPKLPKYPRVDSELLDYIRQQHLGQYITYYNSRNKERSHNIHLASEAIDNHVVFPGETFSFNGVVGKRTKEKGYLPAPIIVKGELSEGIGGGICQVSSTLFNAVDKAGLQIIERYSHSKQVPYVPPGRDATVSWYGPDFTFQNLYQQPILIRAKAINGSMIVNIYSSLEVKPKLRNIPDAEDSLPKEIMIDPGTS